MALPSRPSALILDFDGVLTDNRVIVHEDGTESVVCHRGDGLGLERVQARGLPVVVISKERNPVVTARCRKLRVDCLQGVDDKLPRLREWLAARDLDIASAIYVGNDINDASCLAAVGCPVVVGDAHPDVKPLAAIVLRNPGGHGAVRELCDRILQETELRSAE
jgi:YrbI family 3-deoxy-D-manno-octulosonate 8-phosphate phosphatase